MIRLKTFAVIAAPLLLAAAAYAGTDVAVPSFASVAAHSGADVKVIYGTTQRVTLIKGDLKKGRIEVKNNGTLEISGCEGFCWGNHALDVEVVVPRIDAISASSGADVKTSGNFPKQAQLSVQAQSGGEVDAGAIPADTVNVQAHSGGSAHVKVLSTLNAHATSGGDITYTGHPPHINSQTNSGGDISGD